MRTLAGLFIYMKYDKPPLTYDQQVELLKSRGLIIKNKQKIKSLLKQISYYRISAYFLPFQKEKDLFIPGTSIEDIETLYNFDRELLNLIFTTISRVEIPIRTRITYLFVQKYGPIGYTQIKNFRDGFYLFEEWLSKLRSEIKRSKETFIRHYKRKYADDSPDYPMWMVAEIMSFGSLSVLYKGMNKYDKSNISQEFGLQPVVFESWLHSLVYIRNLCAHHNRLWNRTLGVKPKIPKLLEIWHNPFTIDNSKMFSIFTVLKFLLGFVDPSQNFTESLMDLLEKYEISNLQLMGFPNNWLQHKVWKPQ